MIFYQLLSLFNNIVYVYTILLVIYALLSWFPGGYQSGFGKLLSRICEPYLSLFDHLNLRLGPIDFTIAAAIIILNLASQALTTILANLIF